MKNRKSLTQKTLRGDTLVEVMFAVGIFALAAISASALMNKMLGNAQASLEITMARTEIDSQAEALRYLSESYSNAEYQAKWDQIDLLSQTATDDPITANPVSCDIDKTKAFAVNPRTLDIISGDSLTASPLFPRIFYQDEDASQIDRDRAQEDSANSATAQGIWVTAYKSQNHRYYDFYIQTCWYAPGKSAPTTINTSIRINNPNKSDAPIAIPDPGDPQAGQSSPNTCSVTFYYYDPSQNPNYQNESVPSIACNQINPPTVPVKSTSTQTKSNTLYTWTETTSEVNDSWKKTTDDTCKPFNSDTVSDGDEFEACYTLKTQNGPKTAINYYLTGTTAGDKPKSYASTTLYAPNNKSWSGGYINCLGNASIDFKITTDSSTEEQTVTVSRPGDCMVWLVGNLFKEWKVTATLNDDGSINFTTTVMDL